jgi:hypothetical protein
MGTKRTKEEWAILINEYKKSGEPLATWCNAKGVSAKTMSNHTKSNLTNKRKPSVKRTIEEWRLLLSDLESSNLSQSEWCRKNGLNENSVYSAQYRLAKSVGEAKRTPAYMNGAGFIRVQPTLPDETVLSGCVKIAVKEVSLEANSEYPVEQLYTLIRGLR